MGQGFNYYCKKCEEDYSVHLGSGFSFPNVYREAINDILSGKFGEERKSILECDPFIAVDAEQYVYKCQCGYWKVDLGLSLYAPNDRDALAKKKFGKNTVEKLGYVPYVINYELKTEYHLIKRFIHTCPECSKKMKRATGKELFRLKCPTCGGMCDEKDIRRLFWD